jgi:hypothetical protein
LEMARRSAKSWVEREAKGMPAREWTVSTVEGVRMAAGRRPLQPVVDGHKSDARVAVPAALLDYARGVRRWARP